MQGTTQSFLQRLIHISLSALLLAAPLAAQTATSPKTAVKAAPDYTRNVDPFIGVDWGGNTFVDSTISYGLVKIGQREAAFRQRRQRIALGQTGIDESEPGLADTEDLAGPIHLGSPDLGDVGPDLRPVEVLVQHAAALAAGARDHQHVDSVGDILRHRRGTLA